MPSWDTDIQPLRETHAGDPAHRRVVSEISEACRDLGFLSLMGHGIDQNLQPRLESAASEFFSQPEEVKQRVAMSRGGRAWRGWFPLGGELTSGEADAKEGYYFGTDLAADHPLVAVATPLHGANLYPAHPSELESLVEQWMNAVTEVGQLLLGAMALGLGLPQNWFDRWCAEPLVLFRIFHYPAPPAAADVQWGVAEHTDYGLLTLLATDDSAGLEVHTPDGWEPVRAAEGAIVCNLGDMLERTTGGLYRSTLHRVRRPDRDRISMPLFLDPAWNAIVEPIDGLAATDDTPRRRWDGVDPLEGPTRYGDYLGAKVSKVFPELFDSAMVDDGVRTRSASRPQ